MKYISSIVVALGVVASIGCGGDKPVVKTGGEGKVGGKTVVDAQPGGAPVTKEAADAFTDAVSEFKKNEEARNWDDAKCDRIALGNSISLKALEARAPSLPKGQELIFYCA